jgi:hypothetical protein
MKSQNMPNFIKKTTVGKKFYFEVKIRSAVNVKIITHLFVLKNALSDGRCINPGDKVLHVAGHDEGRVLDHIRANSNMTLLDELSCCPEIFTHLGTDEDDRESCNGKGKNNED